jgi:signal peptide peptidase SppA
MNEAILSAIQSDPWMVEPLHLEALLKRLSTVESATLPHLGKKSSSSDLGWRQGEWAVIPISGVLMKEVPWYFGQIGMDATSYGDIVSKVKKATADDSVKGIILKVSSPGGQVSGAQEAADAIYEARGKKPIHAFCEDITASGAYLLASQANSISANSNAIVGSIGVYAVYTDFSGQAEQMGIHVHVIRSGEHKGMGVPGSKISNVQLTAQQELIDGMAANFKKSVIRGRGMSQAKVDNLATGKCWLADQAKICGLIDRVGTFENVTSGTMTEPLHCMDFMELTKTRAEEKKIGISEAMIQVDRENPGLRQEWIKSQRRINVDTNVQGSGKTVPKLPGCDFMSIAKARAEERKIGISEAMSQVDRENPGLRQKCLEMQ